MAVCRVSQGSQRMEPEPGLGGVEGVGHHWHLVSGGWGARMESDSGLISRCVGLAQRSQVSL